ncbi:MAG: hypothetical protein ACLSGT_05270 [Oscillospiraceae bacterium]
MAYLLRYGEYLLFRCNLMTYCVIVRAAPPGWMRLCAGVWKTSSVAAAG